MPVDLSRYPANWGEISLRIRNRANWVCECNGECGGHKGPCPAHDGVPHPLTGSIVILTVAHLGTGTGDKHDKMDVRDENLKAMCQRCHLLFDIEEHIANAKATRRRHLIEAGQLEMSL